MPKILGDLWGISWGPLADLWGTSGGPLGDLWGTKFNTTGAVSAFPFAGAVSAFPPAGAFLLGLLRNFLGDVNHEPIRTIWCLPAEHAGGSQLVRGCC